MHELAICQGLMSQVSNVAASHGASRVERVIVRVGALSGVEAPLLQRAFEVARAGTAASEAKLEIQEEPVEVRCRECGAQGGVPANRLLCPECGDWRVRVTRGEELTLMSLDLSGLEGEKHV